MKSLKLALKKHPIVYIARDLERALGLSSNYQDYYIITNKASQSQKPKTGFAKNIIFISGDHILDTHELLVHPKTIAFFKKLTSPRILVFKNNSTVEKICHDHNWTLLNPPAALSIQIEGKISQIAWLDTLASLLPPHQVDLLKNISWPGTKFIMQFNNRVHTGQSTLLINNLSELQTLQQRFPKRTVRVFKFIEGMMFTNNNIVWGNKVLTGNINYQITGLHPFTDHPFATIGNDWGLPHKSLTKKLQQDYFKITKLVGKKLINNGWRGLFGIDVILDSKKKKWYLIEVNARQPASTTYESQLQESQKSKVKSQKYITTFEAHLASLLKVEYTGEKLIAIKEGAQIIQRVKEKTQPTNKLEKVDIKLIQKSISHLVDDFRQELYNGSPGFVDELLQANETHLAVETLCEQIHDTHTILNSYSYEELIKIAKTLKIKPLYWSNLPKEKLPKINLSRSGLTLISYTNTEPGADALRIQSKKSIMENHNQFNELGKKIKTFVLEANE